jgi:hypothetical protein
VVQDNYTIRLKIISKIPMELIILNNKLMWLKKKQKNLVKNHKILLWVIAQQSKKKSWKSKIYKHSQSPLKTYNLI